MNNNLKAIILVISCVLLLFFHRGIEQDMIEVIPDFFVHKTPAFFLVFLIEVCIALLIPNSFKKKIN